uniref:Capsid protein n=1 Tax=Caloscypha fulgens partitivirus 6 TaxID=2778764 RepID=A0A7L8Y966_9VIRU|nr:capsid protein [Caloscypha fulgens partitivirus 6]
MASRAPRTSIPMPSLPMTTATDQRPAEPIPIVPDIVTRLAPSTNTRSSSGDTIIIDVITDNREPLCSWIYSIGHSIPSGLYSTNPMASPASILAYTQIMYVAFAFTIDAKLRFTPTPAAYNILNDAMQTLIFETLLEFPVPAFAHLEFDALRPHFDDLSDNLCYFASLGSSSFFHDFGRLIPATAFTAMHNLLAQLPTNTNYASLAANYYGLTITQADLGPNQAVNLTPGHYFGTCTTSQTQNTYHYYPNWFNRRIDNLLTANAIRVVNASATVSRLPMFTPANVTPANYNPYLYAIGYDYRNAGSILELVRNLAGFIKEIFPASRPLSAYTQMGTPEIARHLVFNSCLPTWHTGNAPSSAQLLAENANPFRDYAHMRSPSQFATEINYLVNYPTPAANTTPASFVGQNPVSANANTGRFAHLMTNSTNVNEVHSARIFDDQLHSTPDAAIFDPTSRDLTHLAAVITSGKKIETNDSSAIGLLLPHPMYALNQQNAAHIQGAVPLRQIRDATTNSAFIVRRRTHSTAQRAAQILIRGLPSAITIPLFSNTFTTPVFTIPARDNVLDAIFPGIAPNVCNYAPFGLNAFAAPLGRNRTNIPDQFFPLWSSYRYFDTESQTWYMLPTLRHIYGTRARLFTTLHPSLRIN